MRIKRVATHKSRERRARRACDRRGLMLRRSPRRDPDALDYGTFKVLMRSTGQAAQGTPLHGFPDLLSVERWLIDTSGGKGAGLRIEQAGLIVWAASKIRQLELDHGRLGGATHRSRLSDGDIERLASETAVALGVLGRNARRLAAVPDDGAFQILTRLEVGLAEEIAG